MLYTIFGLQDPRDGLIYFVAMSRVPESRIKHHLAGYNFSTGDWVRYLAAEGVEPELVVIEQIEVSNLKKALVHKNDVIERHRTKNPKLINVSDSEKVRRIKETKRRKIYPWILKLVADAIDDDKDFSEIAEEFCVHPLTVKEIADDMRRGDGEWYWEVDTVRTPPGEMPRRTQMLWGLLGVPNIAEVVEDGKKVQEILDQSQISISQLQ